MSVVSISSLKRHASAVLLSKFLSINSTSPQERRRQAENTLIVSPDNASRRAINQAVRQELQAPYDPSRLRGIAACLQSETKYNLRLRIETCRLPINARRKCTGAFKQHSLRCLLDLE